METLIPECGLRGPLRAHEALVFEDGPEQRCQGLLVATRMRQRSWLAVTPTEGAS
jgi:hypothetical protein